MATVKKQPLPGKKVKPTADSSAYFTKEMENFYDAAARNMNSKKYADAAFKGASQSAKDLDRQSNKGKTGYDANGFPIKKKKSGGKVMMKRADGSTSQRGLWDNIRANKGSGKKPTSAMLKQEKKIKAASKKK